MRELADVAGWKAYHATTRLRNWVRLFWAGLDSQRMRRVLMLSGQGWIAHRSEARPHRPVHQAYSMP